jgi:hypothetical protein
MQNGAIFSECGAYRYHLWRNWREGDRICWLMLNPSTADAKENDPTITKCLGFSKRWGYGGLDVVNLYGYRSTDPGRLREATDPVGPRNDRIIEQVARSVSLVICAWGANGRTRANSITRRLRMLGIELHHIGLTAKGHPYHPLMVPYNQPLSVWT